MRMMQMKVEEVSHDGLKLAFNVRVANAAVVEVFTERLLDIGRNANIQGFRKGKAPLEILKQRYGDSVHAEVLDQTVAESTERALSERNLRPAMQPKVELVNFAEGQDLEYKLAVEVLPIIMPMDFATLSFEKPVADVAAATIDEAVTRLAKAMREPEVVADPRPARIGDVLEIDFDGTVDGVAQPGMKAEGHRLELGSKSFIDTFEEQLVGAKVGDELKVTVTFPADYHAANLAGKQAVFAVAVKALLAPKPVEMNDELARDIGFGTLAELRKRIADDIGADYARLSRSVLKRQLMDRLADAHSFELPIGLVEAEFEAIWQQVQADKAKGELPQDEAKKSDDELKKDYQAIAARRVRLGLLLAEVARLNDVKVSPAELRNAMMAEARRFPGQEKAVIDYYTQTPGAMERLRAPLLEEKVVDYILAQTKLGERKISAEELMKLPELTD